VGAPALAKDHPVVELDLAQAVQPLSASYLTGGIHQAERDGARAVLIRIDTPGGLISSTRNIVGAILRAKVPVVCWVGPSGARAASAGTFILLACHVAVMAPGTNVGAAHPVGIQGQVMTEKVTNDSAAFIRSIAEERGRNAAWAEKAVRDSVSVSAEEALRLHVIDGVADSAEGALRAANERTMTIDGHAVTVATWPATIQKHSIPFGRGLLGSLIDPNFAFVLFLLGLAGLVFEILHPGLSVPGILGLLALVLALVMFEMLPVTLAGLILLVAGVGFLVVELHIPGHGLAAAAGVVALAVGGLLLFDAGSLVRVSRPLLVGVVIAKAAFILLVVRKAVQARRMPPPIPRSVVGMDGVVTSDLDPVGTVRVRSEEWTATSTGTKIEAGSKVRVVAEEGLKLRVDKDGATAPPSEGKG
jgi:membrane-bound serine protease (ClpP class)